MALALGTLRDLIAPAELQPAKSKGGSQRAEIAIFTISSISFLLKKTIGRGLNANFMAKSRHCAKSQAEPLSNGHLSTELMPARR